MLRNRVRTYFHSGIESPQDTPDGFTTLQASIQSSHPQNKMPFMLENTLIKQHRPRYNVVFRDDKDYPCLRLAIEEPYPNLTISRRQGIQELNFCILIRAACPCLQSVISGHRTGKALCCTCCGRLWLQRPFFLHSPGAHRTRQPFKYLLFWDAPVYEQHHPTERYANQKKKPYGQHRIVPPCVQDRNHKQKRYVHKEKRE